VPSVQAIVVHQLGGAEGAVLETVPDPPPAGPEGRLLVEVHAAGLGFRDVLIVEGAYQIRPDVPFVPGGELAGIVREAPAGSRVRPGDRVAAATGVGGALCEFAVADPRWVLRLPDDYSFAAGAAIMINYTTAWFALDRCGVGPGHTVLIQGAAGGVGTATIELARAAGATCIAIVSTDAKHQAVRRLGAEHVVRTTDPWLETVRTITARRGVDAVIDMVGGDRFTDSVRSLATGGQLAVVGFAGGSIPELKLNRLLLRSASIHGIELSAYSATYPHTGVRAMDELERLLRDGAVNPLIGVVERFDRAAEALRIVKERRVLGKAVVAVKPGVEKDAPL
jgi:NADPH2:quinone reductase